MAKKAVLKIVGMHCTSCAFSIDGDLEDTEGVKSAKTSYARQECEVEFDEEKIQIKHIIKTVRESGYNAHLKGF